MPIDTILNIAAGIDGVLWGPWTMIFLAAVALFFTIKFRFFQFRHFGFIWRNTFGKIFEKKNTREKGKMTPFQATTTALASTVGMGNIAGVATALSVGGPGAIFWMWLLALLGMITKTVEITLAVHYRESDPEGGLHGGPMYYINKALGWKTLAKLFSLGVFINSILCATLLQSHTVGRAFLTSYNWDPYLVTAGMAVVTGIVVIGGFRRIGQFSEKLVPIMAVVYLICGIIIFLINFTKIPEVFALIFRYAFSPAPAVGGFAGVTVAAAIKNGMARGMLSNEAGEGTAPMVHATAHTEHPFQQGMWGAFEVFVDTILICTITAFSILSTGVLAGGQSGIDLVIKAFSEVFPKNLAEAIISFCILAFCLTTQIGFFIYYETSIINLFGRKAMRWLKWFYLIPGVVFAGVTNVDGLWIFANIAVGACAIPNLIALLALTGAFMLLMRDYLSGNKKYATAVIDSSHQYVKTPRKKISGAPMP